MRLHLVSLPWTHTTRDWLTCAYTQKVVKAGRMYVNAGHEVVIYSGEYNEAVCTEHVPVLSEEERAGWFGSRDANDMTHGGLSWDRGHPAWVTMNTRAAQAIKERAASKHDLVLLIGGNCQYTIAEAVEPLQSIEYGVGYEGVFTWKCAFESHVWRHHVYGLMGIKNGRWYDATIPNYFDLDEFPADLVGKKSDYLLFIGRVIQRKGPHIAAMIAEQLGVRLLVAGAGVERVEKLPGGGERIYGTDSVVFEGKGVHYVGPVGFEVRAELLAAALATLVPTIYLEPFGGVAVESMLAGTPAVAPDYGAFTETIEEGVTGYRFNTLAEGCRAVERAVDLPPAAIRHRAASRYSLEAVAPQFDRWFEQIDGLWGVGWDAPPAPTVPFAERVRLPHRASSDRSVPVLTSASERRRRIRAITAGALPSERGRTVAAR